MILLTNVATKLQELLNSFDSSDYSFVVKSAGYHLDSVSNKKESRNQIPVFISQVGGEYNPVPNLHQVNFTYEINIYYPVRFKEDFYNLNANLQNWFVGKKVAFGDENALCNISVAEYGEIIDFEAIRSFENWVAEEFNGSVRLFKEDKQVNEFYMSMRFRLFCTTLGEGFLFGNDVKYELTATFPTIIDGIEVEVATNTHYQFTRYETGDLGNKHAWKYQTTIIYTNKENSYKLDSNSKIYTYDAEQEKFIESEYTFLYSNPYVDTTNTQKLTEQLVWDQSGTGASISPVSEQLIGVDKFLKNTPNITNFNKSITIYVKDDNFWKVFLYCYNKQDLDLVKNISFSKIYKLGENDIKYTYNQILLSYSENIELGSPLSFTLTFGDGE